MINYIEIVIDSLLCDFLLRGPSTEILIGNVTGGVAVTTAAADAISTTTSSTINNPQGQQRENADICLPNNTSSTSADVTTAKRLVYKRLSSRQHFATIVYLLSETHDLLMKRTSCTYRELLYKNIHFPCNPAQIARGVKDISCMLNETSWNLGIFATGRGSITGPVLIYMSTGDVIDCNCLTTPTLIPPNFTHIDHFETSAQFVLVVEKDTIFKKMLLYNLFLAMDAKVVLITAKGYPDVSTRWLLSKLVRENHLTAYMLADGDPFGIEIMLTYRHGSQALHSNVADLSCPSLLWLGIHPSDIVSIKVNQEPLVAADYRKIDSLMRRQYVTEEIRRELIILRLHQHKVKIDNMSAQTFSLFINDYIINKIKRQVVI